jgi:hypothetical protein
MLVLFLFKFLLAVGMSYLVSCSYLKNKDLLYGNGNIVYTPSVFNFHFFLI